MSNTPRTDREIEDARNVALDFETRDKRVDLRESVYVVSAKFARQLERELHLAKNALKLLHDETADYIRINRLGKVHHNESMKRAALVLGIPLEE